MNEMAKVETALGTTMIADLLNALVTINRIHDLGDAVYDVREREMKGWDGPEVTEYSNALRVVLPVLKAWEATEVEDRR